MFTRSHRQPAQRTGSALLITALLVLAACGSDSKTSPTTTAASAATTTAASAATTTSGGTATTTAPTTVATTGAAGVTTTAPAATSGEPLKIGLLTDRSGPFSDPFGISADIGVGWGTYVNDNGGVGGRPVDIKIYDTKASGPDGLVAAKQAVADGVDVVLVFDPATDTVINPYFNDQNIPVVGAMGYAPDAWSLPNTFKTFTEPLTAASIYADGPKEVGSTRMSLVVCNEVPSCAGAVPLIQARAQALGVAWAGVVQASLTQPSYTAECLSLIEKKSDFIAGAVSAAANKRLFADCTQQGYSGWFGIAASSVSGPAIEATGAQVAGGINSFPWFLDNPAVKNYLAALKKYAPSARADDAQATAVWAALEMLRKAMNGAGSDTSKAPTPKDVIAAMKQVKNEDLGGLLPGKFSYGDEAGQNVKCYWTYRFENGKFSVGNDSKPVCQ